MAPLSDELDHHCLVGQRGRMFDARGDLSSGLVQAARELGPFAVFVQRNRSGGHRGDRVSDAAHPDSRAI